MVCHGELARTRPPTDDLTVFYLVMSIGGALGGLFNALVAPLSSTIPTNIEIVLVLAALMMPRLEESDPLLAQAGRPTDRSRKHRFQNWAWTLWLPG